MDVFANTILPETVSHFYLLHLDYKFKIEKLVEKKIHFIGVDCPGIREHEEHQQADRFCERHGVYVIENLKNLADITAETFTVYTMWLDDAQMTGLRCRVLAEMQ